MPPDQVQGLGTREQPWILKTPSGTSEYQMYRDEAANPPALVCTVGKQSCATTCAAWRICGPC